MNIALIGYGVEGRSSYEYFTKRGHEVTICDFNPSLALPENAQTQLGEAYLADLERFDLIVRSAGIHPSVILDEHPSVYGRITTAVNEFLKACPTPNVIGVTGTKGKGTTSTLIAMMLTSAGKTVHLGGNIGISPLDFIDDIQIDDWVVLELSSFQLSDATHSPHIGVCLMVVPEHLNWHSDMADYVAAKSNLFRWQSADDVSIYFAENAVSEEIASHGKGKMEPFYTKPGAQVINGEFVIHGHSICKTSELKLRGEHNWQNACAALTAAWHATHNVRALRGVLMGFSGLEHRLETVREVNGVQYVDDSFGTTPETASVAIQAFDQPKIVILGGSKKGASFDELAHIVATSNVKKVIIIDNQSNAFYEPAGPEIEAALRATGYTAITNLLKPNGGPSMAEIIQEAQASSAPGDVVLLSAACASFDMFTDYKDRARQFTEAVQALA